MSLKRFRATATSTMSNSQVNSFRTEKINAYGPDEIGGVIIVDEGHFWIELEGPTSELNDALGDLQVDTRIDDFDLLEHITVPSRLWSNFFTYNKTEKPLAS